MAKAILVEQKTRYKPKLAKLEELTTPVLDPATPPCTATVAEATPPSICPF